MQVSGALGRENIKCKGPEAEAYLACSRDTKEAGVSGLE